MNLGNKSIKNGIWLYLLQFFNTVVPLITLPYVVKILGGTYYGIFSLSFNIVSYFQVIVEYGFSFSGTRKVSLVSSKNDLNTFFTNILLSRCILCISCILCLIIFFTFSDVNETQKTCIMILLLIPIGTILDMTWFYQGLQKVEFIAVISIISRIISLLLIFSFVKSKNDLYIYCLFYSCTNLFIGFMNIYTATSKFQLRFVKVKFKNIITEMKEGWYVFTTSLSSKVFGVFGITILGLFSTSLNVGVFSAIQKIPNTISLAWSPISQLLFPISSRKMSNSFSEGKRYIYEIRRKIVPIYVVIIILIAIFAKSIVIVLFGKEFASYYYIIYPLLLWLLFGILNNFLGIQILLGAGFSKEYSKCFQISVVFTIFFNLIFIYTYNILGAAIAPLCSELLLFVLLIKKIRSIQKKMDC